MPVLVGFMPTFLIIIEELGIEGEMMAIQMTEKTSDYVQFMALFTEEDSNISIEEVVKDYMSK